MHRPESAAKARRQAARGNPQTARDRRKHSTLARRQRKIAVRIALIVPCGLIPRAQVSGSKNNLRLTAYVTWVLTPLGFARQINRGAVARPKPRLACQHDSTRPAPPRQLGNGIWRQAARHCGLLRRHGVDLDLSLAASHRVPLRPSLLRRGHGATQPGSSSSTRPASPSNVGTANAPRTPAVFSPRFSLGAKALNDSPNSSAPFSSPSCGLALLALNPLYVSGEKFGLARNRAWPFPLCFCSFSRQPAALTESRLAELRSARLQSPVAVTAPRACPAERDRSLPARIRPPLCSALFLFSDRALLSQQFACPA